MFQPRLGATDGMTFRGNSGGSCSDTTVVLQLAHRFKEGSYLVPTRNVPLVLFATNWYGRVTEGEAVTHAEALESGRPRLITHPYLYL